MAIGKKKSENPESQADPLKEPPERSKKASRPAQTSKPLKPARTKKQAKSKNPENTAASPAKPRLRVCIALPVRRLTLFFGVLLLVFTLLLALLLNGILDKRVVADGVTVMGYSVSGFSRDELIAELGRLTADLPGNAGIRLYHQDYEDEIAFSELGVHPDLESTAEAALLPGQTGSIVRRLTDRLEIKRSGLSIPLISAIDGDRLDALLQTTHEALLVPSVAPELTIGEDRTTLSSGTGGQSVDTQLLAARIDELVQTGRSGSIHVPVVLSPMPEMDAKELYVAIVRSPSDAIPVPDDSGGVVIRPAVSGRSIDEAVLVKIVESMNARSERSLATVELPVVYAAPALSTAAAEAMLFRDVLGESRSTFSEETDNDRSRANNIRLAAQALNGTILWPGETLSFNDTVGERTAGAGYTPAHAYAAGGIVDEVGGGICQVSSALLNAALLAGLDVEERHPHSFAVSYAPYGRDAAVSWPDLDLKISNVWEWPVRLDAQVRGSSIRISLSGANLHPDYSIKVYTRTLSTIPLSVEVTEDPSLTKGTEVLLEEGFDGAVVETHRNQYRGETLIEQVVLFKSEYRPFPERRVVGTGTSGADSVD